MKQLKRYELILLKSNTISLNGKVIHKGEKGKIIGSIKCLPNVYEVRFNCNETSYCPIGIIERISN